MQIEDYVFRIMDNNVRMQEVLGEYNWNVDMRLGTIAFKTKSGAVIATCPVQLVGSEANGTWLWAWANKESNPPADLLVAVGKLKEDGTEAHFQITEEFPVPSETFGHEMAILCAGLSGSYGTFRCPFSGGALYVVVESFPKARNLPFNANRTTQAVLAAISTFKVKDHRAAWEAFPVGERLEVSFDDQDRIKNIQMTLSPENLPTERPSLLGRLFGKRNG